MFEIFKKLRALCARNKTEVIVVPMASRSIYQGKVSTVRRRRGAVVKHLPVALAVMLFASMASAFPPPSDYVETVTTAVHEQRIELVRAAFHATHHPTEWSDFAPAAVYASPNSDRVSIESILGGNSLQRRNAVNAIFGPYSPLVLEAYYPGF